MTGHGPPGLRRGVVAGGAGAVGSLFADRLSRSGVAVCIADRSAPARPGHDAARVLLGDITDPGPELKAEIAAADLVLLAVPEPVALAAINPLAGALRPGALLADTLSVKARVADAVRTMTTRAEAVSINPMFAPSLGFAGRPVAAVVVRDGPRGRALLDLIGTWGARIVVVTADQHDRLAAASQALTHATVLAFGLALAELQVDVADLGRIAPPPHATLLSLLARIASGTPEVYWDVQAANPYAPSARAALARGVSRLTQLLDQGDEAAFIAVLSGLGGGLGPALGCYRETCARIFRAMNFDLENGAGE